MNYTADETTSIEVLYRGRSLQGISVADELVAQYNLAAEELDLEPISSDIDYGFDFNIPQQYLDIDVEEYVKSLVPAGMETPDVAARVEQELMEYKARNLYPVLQLMIYIVDTLRSNNLVWGVGRGSSVASYCLYLIGVHKIDSIKYDLDIREFLK